MKTLPRRAISATSAILAVLCLTVQPWVHAQSTNPVQSVLVINVYGFYYDPDGYNVFLTVSNARARRRSLIEKDFHAGRYGFSPQAAARLFSACRKTASA